jgi:hypothetical protein
MTKLTEALETRRKRLVRSQLTTYLQQIRSLVFEGFAETEEDSEILERLWSWVIKRDAAPSYRLDLNATDRQQEEWLAQCLRLSHLRDRGYLFIAGFGAPFAVVRFVDDAWLRELWRDESHRDILVLSYERKYALAITEEEYQYYAFLFEVQNGSWLLRQENH